VPSSTKFLSMPLQRIQRASSPSDPSPDPRNRREVTVPYRVLQDSEVSGVLGCPFPVRRWRSLNAPSFRYFFLCPRQRMRLRGQSSRGVRPFYTVFPKPPPPVSQPEAPLLGFHAATTHKGEESPRPTFAGPPVLPGYLSTGPTPQTTVSLAGFPNLSATFFLSPPSHHFQVGGVPAVRPTGVCSSHEAPLDSSSCGVPS
jgi:hypothetical protein